MKRIAIIVGLVVLIPFLAIAALLAFATGEQLKPVAEWTLSRTLDRPVTIATLGIDRGRVTTLSVTDLVIGDPQDEAAPFVQLGNGVIDVAVRDLLRARPKIMSLTVDEAEIHQTLQTGDEDTDQQTSIGFPQVFVDQIDIQNVLYRQTTPSETQDEPSDLSVKLTRAAGRYVPGEAVQIEGTGVYLEEQFDFTVSADAASTLATSEEFPISLEISGAIEGSASATIQASGDVSPIEFSISGPTVAALSALSPVPLPETPPFSLSGLLSIDPQIYKIENMAGTIGDSDVTGTLLADLTGALPYVDGVIRSTSLDFDDLASLIGGTPDPNETASAEQQEEAAAAGAVPDTAIPAAALKSLNFNITFVAESVSSPIAQIDAIDAKLVLSEGRLLISPLTLGVSGGTAEGEIALNVREDVPSADIDLSFFGVSLVNFFQGSQFAEEMGGSMAGDIYFLGVGQSLADMFATVRGDGELFLTDGKVSALLVEAGGVDIAESLGVLLAGDAPIAMPCAGVSLTASDGIVAIQRAQAVTSDSLIQAVGDIVLETLSFRVTLEAQAWDFSLLDLNAPVSVVGTPAGVTVSIGRIEGFPLFRKGAGAPISCETLRQNVSNP